MRCSTCSSSTAVFLLCLFIVLVSGLKAVPDPQHNSKETHLQKTLLPYTRYITERLLRLIKVNNQLFAACTETEKAVEGDNWMWTDDNAKTLELLTIPGVYEMHAEPVNRILGFVLEMMKNDMIIRRVATDALDHNMGRFVVESSGPSDFRFHNPLMTFHGKVDAITQSFRFHDGRDKDAMLYYLGNVHLQLEDGSTLELTPEAKQSRLRLDDEGHLSAASYGLLSKPNGDPMAFFSHDFTVSADRVVTEQTFKLSPISRDLHFKEVRMSFDVDCALPGKGDGFANGPWEDFVHFDRVCWGEKDHTDCRSDMSAGAVKNGMISFSGRPTPTWMSAVRAGNAGFSYGLHFFLRNESAFQHLGYDAKRTRWMTDKMALSMTTVRTHYKCTSVTADSPCIIQEGKLLVGGGLHDDLDRYKTLLPSIRNGEDDGIIDYSISYDIGAEVNSLSSLYMFYRAKRYRDVSGVDMAVVRDTIDRHIKVYFSIFTKRDSKGILSSVFVRGLSFIILALNNMYAATKDYYYAERLDEAIGMLKELKTLDSAALLFRCFGNEERSAVDCHTSGILALSRVVATFPFDRVKPTSKHLVVADLSEVLWKHGPRLFKQQKQRENEPQWGLQGDEGVNFEWSFQCALTLRSFHALKLARERFPNDPSLREINPGPMNALIHDCSDYLETSTKEHNKGRDEDYMKEIKTSLRSFETNTETQPWATLGLYGEGVERLVQSAISDLFKPHLVAGDDDLPHARRSSKGSSGSSAWFFVGLFVAFVLLSAMWSRRVRFARKDSRHAV